MMKKQGLAPLKGKADKISAKIKPHSLKTDSEPNTLQFLQSELLSEREKLGQRAPGRARVDRIIEATIELLKAHKPADISIAMIADHGGITRTSIYSHFASVDEILGQIAIRFVQQTGVEVEGYVRRRKPESLEQLVTLMIKGIQDYFNQPNPAKPGALARHIPFESRHLVRDFDKVAALPYHTLWHTGWAIEPLSEEDPFRTLVIIQSAIFEASIQQQGKITDLAVKQATEVALDFLARAEARYGAAPEETTTAEPTPEDRIMAAARTLAAHDDPALIEMAIAQIELLASTVTKLAAKPAARRRKKA